MFSIWMNSDMKYMKTLFWGRKNNWNRNEKTEMTLRKSKISPNLFITRCKRMTIKNKTIIYFQNLEHNCKLVTFKLIGILVQVRVHKSTIKHSTFISSERITQKRQNYNQTDSDNFDSASLGAIPHKSWSCNMRVWRTNVNKM